MDRRSWLVVATVVATLLALSTPSTGGAQEEPTRPDAEALGFITGKSWGRSSYGERAAFMVGVGNLLNVEYAFQQRSGNPPGSKQTLITRTWEAVAPLTVDQVVKIIDDWYDANPDENDKPVLDVLWDQVVEPTLRQKKGS